MGQKRVRPPFASSPTDLLLCCAEIEGFFNLLFSHFLVLYPIDAPETRTQLDALLSTISSSPNHTSTKYHMCGTSCLFPKIVLNSTGAP